MSCSKETSSDEKGKMACENKKVIMELRRDLSKYVEE
jgi:hypothetical protein